MYIINKTELIKFLNLRYSIGETTPSKEKGERERERTTNISQARLTKSNFVTYLNIKNNHITQRKQIGKRT